MSDIIRVGVDLVKRVIQFHAVNAAGQLVAAKAPAYNKLMPWWVLTLRVQDVRHVGDRDLIAVRSLENANG